jgi:hypothetical protein
MLDTTITGPNWPLIRADYEAGVISIRQIAGREGVSDTAIHKRAKSEGWDTGLRSGANHEEPPAQTALQTTIARAVEKYCGPGPIDDDFDWAEDDSVIVPSQRATAAYRNNRGEVIIRQENECDGDQFVILMRSQVDALVARLRDLADGEA